MSTGTKPKLDYKCHWREYPMIPYDCWMHEWLYTFWHRGTKNVLSYTMFSEEKDPVPYWGTMRSACAKLVRGVRAGTQAPNYRVRRK